MFACAVCGYQTKRKFNLNQHNNRAKPCFPPQEPIITPLEELEEPEEPSSEENQCVKCKRTLSSLHSLKRHELTCNGCHVLQCPVCLKMFSNRSGKCTHMKNVICKRPECSPTNAESDSDKIARLEKTIKIMESNSKGSTTINNGEVNNITARLEKLIEDESHKDELHKQELQALRDTIETLQGLELGVKKKKPKRGFVTPITRLDIAASQLWCCHMCSKTLPGFFNIDHTQPLWLGGTDTRDNLTALCVPCHAEKTHNERKLC